MLIWKGADFVAEWSWAALAGASVTGILVAACGRFLRASIIPGFKLSVRQILPAVPLLICIALICTTWMMSGVVPYLMYHGLGWISPEYFLVVACGVCAVVSLLTGSSWTTIATIGVAFMGIGSGLGFSTGWTAGAIISGAYFGDKMSPLSDTTVIASSTCGVDIMKHIRYMAFTSGPAMAIAMTVYRIAGGNVGGEISVNEITEIREALASSFNLTPAVMSIPFMAVGLMIMRLPTLVTLGISAAAGLAGIFIFQPQMAEGCQLQSVEATLGLLLSGAQPETGHEALNQLSSTHGASGMLPTLILLCGSMVFGGVMIGTGMLQTITQRIANGLKRRLTLVTSTVASGWLLNASTADQYLSIIISGNLYGTVYQRMEIENKVLSRTIEDSTSVTSVLIPWNSCGVTQAGVLGVGTLTYAPFCIFNYLSPLMTILLSVTNFKKPFKNLVTLFRS